MENPVIVSPKLETILASLSSGGDALRQGEAYARRNLLDAARSLIAELETPIETITRITWAEPTLYAALRTSIDLKLFEALGADGDTSQDVNSLAASTDSEPKLLGRLLKHLAAMNIIAEPSAGCFAATRLSEALVAPKYRDGISFNFDVNSGPIANLPVFFAYTRYQNPENAADCPLQYGHGTKKALFEWLVERPKILESFNNHMAGYRQGQHSWMDEDFFPINRALENSDLGDSSPLLVDVGGGIGHEAEEFRNKHPGLPGRLIVQDLPETIQQASKAGQSIELMAHDFFTPQPIEGAKFYYLHSVLHDWSDEKCQTILKELVRAMKPGFSKVLIHEIVVPDQNAHWLMTGLDLIIMVLTAASERTEKQWENLLGSVGLRIVKIWGHPESTKSLIEADLLN